MPRRLLFVAVRSAARTAQIRRAAVIFQKKPFFFSEINPRSRVPLRIFCKKTLQIILKSTRGPERMASGFFFQKNPYFYRKSTRAPQTLSSFFTKTSSDFSQINTQANFDYIFFSQKKRVASGPRAWARPKD